MSSGHSLNSQQQSGCHDKAKPLTVELWRQEEAQEYLDEAKLKELVAKYSEFINFPIYLYASSEVDEPVEEEEEAAPAADDADEVEDEGATWARAFVGCQKHGYLGCGAVPCPHMR